MKANPIFLKFMTIVIVVERRKPKAGVAHRAINAAFAGAGLANLALIIVFAVAAYYVFAAAGLVGTVGGLILAHSVLAFPFVVVFVGSALYGVDPALEEAALDLGATPAQAFWLVILPTLRPAIIAGGLMAFTLSWDELIVTFFTADAASATLPLRIFGLAKVGLNPMINALSALYVLATVAFAVFSARLRRDSATEPLSP